MTLVQTVAEVLFVALQQGAIFALLGIGLTIILGTMKFLNLAHGALYLVGAYAGMLIAKEVSIGGILAGYVANPQQFGLGLDFVGALILVPIIVFVIGVLMERFVARPLYDRPEIDQLLITFGLALIVQEVVKQLVGGENYPSITPQTMFGFDVSGPLTLPLVGTFSRWRLLVVGLTLVIILLTYLLIEKTDFGLVVQAGTRDAEMVRLLGIEIERSYLLVFGIGAALAGLAGLVGATIINLRPAMGTEQALVPAFLTLVVGGAGSVVGAIVGGMLLGLIFAIMSFVATQWAQIVLYGFVAVVLLVRPGGLFGSVEVSE
ncbi:MAG: branched-chain amino acid ABC transporter permease [Haloarculaceae archaeon]